MGREHWVETNFETLGTFINGRAFKPNEWSTNGLPIIRIQNLNNSISNYNYCDFEVPAKYHVHNGDLLFAWSGTPGTSFGAHTWYGGHAVLNQHIFRIEERSDVIDKKFFMYLINSNLNEHIASAHGTAGLAHITKAKFEESVVSIPPLNEQKRIVEKLDAILPKVKNAKARLEKIPHILKKFRQSVLSVACSGRLTEEWQGNRGFDIVYTGVIVENPPHDIPDCWCWVELKELSNGFQYGTSKKSETEGEVPVIRMGNLQNGLIDFTDLKFTNDHSDISKYDLKDGDVLFNRTNSPDLVGKTSVYRGLKSAIFAGYLIRIRHKKELLDPCFLNYCLNTSRAREWCKEVKSDGVSQSNINAQILSSFLMPLPPLEEQQEIVQRVEKLFALADSLETKYKKVIQRVEKIEQSVLAKAFRGELANPDPNDEPATELLNRILQEKATLESCKKPRSKQSATPL